MPNDGDTQDAPPPPTILMLAYWPHAPRAAHHLGWGVRRAMLPLLGMLVVLVVGMDSLLLAQRHGGLAAIADACALMIAIAGAAGQSGFYQVDHAGAPYLFVSRARPAALRGRRPVRRRTFLAQARANHASVGTRAQRDAASREGHMPQTGRGRRAGLDALPTRRSRPHDAAP